MSRCHQCGRQFHGNGNYCRKHEYSQALVLNSRRNFNLVLSDDNLREFRQQADEDFLFESVQLYNDRAIIRINQNRVQCECCQRWFANLELRDDHSRTYTSGCAIHGLCFGQTDNVVHSLASRHTRCFIHNCTSKYRIYDGWDNASIMTHIKNQHWGGYNAYALMTYRDLNV